MFRLLRLTAVLLTLCMGAIGLSRLIGSTQPNPIAAWFTNPDGSACDKPCLFGIQPSVTEFDEAIKILSVHPVTKNFQKEAVRDEGIVKIISLGNQSICVQVWRGTDPNDHYVQAMDLFPFSCPMQSAPRASLENIQELTLGQIVATLGNPNSVKLGGRVDSITTVFDRYYFFGGKLILYIFNKGTCVILPTTAFESLRFHNYDTLDARTDSWHGFARRNLYVVRENQNNCGD